MKIRIITVEREYGSGGAAIAERLANRLGWQLWDRDLTSEIAREAKVTREAVHRCDERVDPLISRLFSVYARGSYERTLPVTETRHFNTDAMVAMLHKVIEQVASKGECVIVGRGSPYILRSRPDAFHVFIYAPDDEKLRRLRNIGQSEKESLQLIQEVDRERASFIRHYFHKEWPHRPLYNLMINSKFGDDYVVETILRNIAALENLRESEGAKAS
ncbi:MAG TPA: cytidylate kinase-like family protein [Candidatus Acidoferrales bacterium]|nr:cytidylate kinase-like family protein [Candidatus Acidoferrales bacterium]